MLKIFSIVALLLGECLIMGTEMFVTKKVSINPSIFKTTFVYAMLINIVACILLVLGYVYGYKSLKNIWIVTAVSIGGILICEPLVGWFLFREIPTTGAAIGLGLGAVGLLVSLFVQ